MKKSGSFELRSGKRLLPTTLALLILPLAAQAASTTWINSGTGDWNNSSNWDGGVPTTGAVVFINNGGGAVFSAGTGTSAAIYTGSTATGSLLVTGGTLSSSAGLVLGSQSTGSGTLTVTGGRFAATTLVVGASGTGTVLLDSGLIALGAGTSNIGSSGGSIGSITVNSGTLTAGSMNIGNVGNGSLAINSGLLSLTGSMTLGSNAAGTGSVTVTGGTLSAVGSLNVGYNGKGTLVLSGGYISSGTTWVSAVGSSSGAVTISSGTWAANGGFNVSGSSPVLISGGLLSSVNGQISGGTSSVRITSGTWTNSGTLNIFGAGKLEVAGGLYTGTSLTFGNGTGTPVVEVSSGTLAIARTVTFGSALGTVNVIGGKMTSLTTIMGQSSSGSNHVANVSTGTWINSGTFTVGSASAGNTLTVHDSGLLFVGTFAVGTAATANNNSVLVTGTGSRTQTTNALTIGAAGSGNTVTLSDGALFMVGDTVNFNTNGGSNNFLRIDDGYLALFGDQTNYVNNILLTSGNIQVWNGAAWVTANTGNFDVFGYYATDSAAYTATGYDGLGGYTLIGTVVAVPEPRTCALILCAGIVFFILRNRRLSSESR